MGSLMAGGGIGGGNAGNYTTSNYSPGTTVNGKGYLLIFPTVAATAERTDPWSGRIMYSGVRIIQVNIDGLGDASIGVNSQDKLYFGNVDPEYITQDAEPMIFMFTKSIVASGDGIQKAILYLEST